MSFEWFYGRWKDLVEIKYGKSLKDYRDSSGSVPVFGTNGAIGWTEKPLCAFPSVIVGRKGAYRGVHFSACPFYVIDTAFFMVPKKDLNIKWAYYHLSLQDINSLDSGSAIPSTSKEDFYSLPVIMPPRFIQDGIVEVLSSVEGKITLNTQINQTLEQMAQALFKSWFVDFDPVIDNALEAGNPIPEPLAERAARRQVMWAADNEVTPERLPAETRRLFPDRFEEDEVLGWVPAGWNTKPVSQILEINPRVKLSKSTIAKYADMKSVPTSGYMIDEVIEKSYSGGAKFEAGDVLLARITPCLENGKTALVDFLDEGEVGFGSTEFIVMRGKGELRTPYVACLARWEEFRQHCIQSMVGSSGRQRIQNACFDSFYVALPECEKPLHLFDRLCGANIRMMTKNRMQTEALTKLRDILLPKLLSGELQLPDAEAAVDTALEAETA